MEETKEKIKKLIERYERLTPEQKKKYNEMTTRKDFIIPLFEALGWDVYNHDQNEVIEEQSAVEGAVDYSFRINNISQFLLEAKALKVDLEKAEWAQQSVDYAWNMGVDWVVLTDFEGLKLFNAEEDVSVPRAIKEFTYKEYLTKFEDLWILSKESFLNGALDKEAQNWGIKAKRLEVTEKLAKDLMEWRDELFNNFIRWNEDKKEEEIDEAVQRILDRLIFIRSCEDRKIEEKKIWPVFQKWELDKSDYNFMKVLRPIFKYYDETYNSNLFKEHFCENLDTDGSPFHKVIKDLYGNEKTGIRYNFAAIKPDVLGAVYEQYLGHILKKSKKKNDADKSKAKRKEQGIYYTPSFIVDYVVENTLSKIIKEKSLTEIQNLKILDPACGSGSFLIKAFDVIDNALKELRRPKDVSDNMHRKYGILSNICGVDLDEQAIEITRLNLLLKAIEPNCKLPYLSDNTKVGNSLISGTEGELKKRFGNNWKDKKPFSWQQEFPEVFKGNNPGFDVIVGNPPYIKEFVNKGAFDGLHDSPYYQGKMDIWTMFACVAIDLLKDGGLLGFIAPNNWITNAGASIFRNKILRGGELKSFIDFGNYKVFKEAGIQTMIFIFEKGKPSKKYVVDYLKINDKDIKEEKLVSALINKKTKINIEPEKLINKNITFTESELEAILEKIQSKKNFELTDKEVGQGIVCPQEYVIDKHLPLLLKDSKPGDGIFVLKSDEVKNLGLNKEETEIMKPFYTTEEISRYFADKQNKLWIIYSDKKVNRNIDKYQKIKQHLQKYASVITSDFGPFGLHRARDSKFFMGPSIFSIRKTNKPQFSYVDFPCYVSQTYFIISTDRIDLKFLMGLLNSRMAYFWLKNKGKLQGDLLQVDKEPLLEIPICVGNKDQQKEIIILVDKMLKLNKEFQKTTEKSDKWYKIQKEIEKTDKIIDQKVYGLYRLTKEEIKIVEEN